MFRKKKQSGQDSNKGNGTDKSNASLERRLGANRIKKKIIPVKINPRAISSEAHIVYMSHIIESYSPDASQVSYMRFQRNTRYVVKHPHEDGVIVHQPVKFSHDCFIKPPVLIKVKQPKEDHSRLMCGVHANHGSLQKFLKGKTYISTNRHPEHDNQPMHTPIRFDHDVVIRKVVKINPANMNEQEQQLLGQLLKEYAAEEFLDVYEFGTKKRKVYLVPVRNDEDVVIYQPVRLAKPLVAFNRKKRDDNYKGGKDKRRYAVCENKPLGVGAEGEVFVSKGTILIQKGLPVYKAKAQREKHRVVKVLSAPKDHNIVGNHSDDRTQSGKAFNEWGFMRQMSIFHSKMPALTNEDNRAAIVMRKLPGMELFDLISLDVEKVIFNVDQRIDFSIKLMEAYIQQVKTAGLVHRDLKPENVLADIDHHGNVKSIYMIDFGLAKFAVDNDAHEHVGTLDYAAPEAFEEEPTSSKSDVFALGKVLGFFWQVLTDERYADLSKAHKQDVQFMLDLCGSEKPENRLSAEDVLAGFKEIKEQRRLGLSGHIHTNKSNTIQTGQFTFVLN